MTIVCVLFLLFELNHEKKIYKKEIVLWFDNEFYVNFHFFVLALLLMARLKKKQFKPEKSKTLTGSLIYHFHSYKANKNATAIGSWGKST